MAVVSRLGRLKRRPEFLRVAARGRKAATPGLVLQALERRDSKPAAQPGEVGPDEVGPDEAGEDDAAVRVGFTASRKVGQAVERNRARRRLRAAVAEVFPTAAKQGRDYVIVARRGTLHRAWPDLLADLRSALERVETSERQQPDRRRRQQPRRGGRNTAARDGARKRTEA